MNNTISEYSKRKISDDITKLQKRYDKVRISIENHNVELQTKMELLEKVAKELKELTMIQQQLKSFH